MNYNTNCFSPWAKQDPHKMLKEVQYYYMLHTPICKYPSIAQLVERWTVVGKHITDIHRSLVRIRFEGYLLYQLYAVESFGAQLGYLWHRHCNESQDKLSISYIHISGCCSSCSGNFKGKTCPLWRAQDINICRGWFQLFDILPFRAQMQ